MWLILFLFTAPADAVDIDEAPSGAIVTVRPDPELGERAWIINEANQPLPLPQGLHKPMWLVHPEVYRNMVAALEGQQILSPLADEQAQVITNLETDLASERTLRSNLRIDHENLQGTYTTETKMLRRSRTHWAIGSGVVGLVLGGVGIGALAL